MAGIVQPGPAVFHFLFSFSWLFENVLENPSARKEGGSRLWYYAKDRRLRPWPSAAVSSCVTILRNFPRQTGSPSVKCM